MHYYETLGKLVREINPPSTPLLYSKTGVYRSYGKVENFIRLFFLYSSYFQSKTLIVGKR